MCVHSPSSEEPRPPARELSASQALSLELKSGLPLKRQNKKTTKPEGDEAEHPFSPANMDSAWDRYNRFHFSDSLSSQCADCRAGLQRRKAAKRESGGQHANVLRQAAGSSLLKSSINFASTAFSMIKRLFSLSTALLICCDNVICDSMLQCFLWVQPTITFWK